MSLLIGFQFESLSNQLAQNFQDEGGHEFKMAKISNATTNPWLDQFVSKVEENNSNLNCHLNMEFSPCTCKLLLH
jgi:hypothetical protein